MVCISDYHKIRDFGYLLMFFENYTVKYIVKPLNLKIKQFRQEF
jgi:hypothetical protein